MIALSGMTSLAPDSVDTGFKGAFWLVFFYWKIWLIDNEGNRVENGIHIGTSLLIIFFKIQLSNTLKI